jgi:hypothetical protein
MEKLAKIIHLAITRWTAKSPKAYRIITDVALGAGIASTTLSLLPVVLPAWVIPTGAFLVALASKLTIEQSNNQ